MPRLLACFLPSLCLLYPPWTSTQFTGDTPASSGPAGKCGVKTFLDIATGECASCPQKQTKSLDGLRCVCVPGLNGTSPRPLPANCPGCSNLPPTTLWEAMFLDASFLACNNTCNVTACQVLTNMVILEAFSVQNRAYDLYTKTRTQDLPRLWYGRTGMPFPRVSFGKSSKVHFKVIKYDARGNFLGWEDVEGGTLQLCLDSQRVLDAAFVFGTVYSQSVSVGFGAKGLRVQSYAALEQAGWLDRTCTAQCTLEVSDLLQRIPEPIFYEMFLEFVDEMGKARLWPVPIENPAIQASGQAPLNSQDLRRFFLVDGLSGRQNNLSNPPADVTFAAELLLTIHLPTSSPGDNPPFLLTVKYAKRGSRGTVQVSFSVSYIQDPGTVQQATNIALGVLGFLSILYALLETSSWVRRSRLPNINLLIIVKFFAFFAGSLANAFFMITLGIGIYWLIVFKGQQFSAVERTLPPPGGQIEADFIAYLLCAFVLKTLDMIHLLITQLTVSIFLMDWEKPMKNQTRKTPAGGDQRAASSVSAWRTFLIANEWNEIQTHRKVSTSLQLFAVLLLLEVVGLKNLASRDLSVNLRPGPNAYQATWSPILRFGIAASVWLAVGLVQIVLSIGFYERFIEDKIHQFVDLCSLSNVSVFILMHRCYGFYIHGRSVHGHADVSLETMYSYIRKEEENRCALRGLEANSDIQTFEVLLTDRTRVLYDRIAQSFMEAARGTNARSDLHKQRLRNYYALNHFLVTFFEHRYRDMDYIVKNKFLLERIMDMEFQEPGDMSVLYNDESALFSRTLFYNRELALLLFEILLFSAVDLAAQDFVLATIVTFIAQKLVQMLRNALGRRNLAEKTLVEKQFLI